MDNPIGHDPENRETLSDRARHAPVGFECQ
jgi:hypothetical protein